jgi:hypothetical protein
MIRDGPVLHASDIEQLKAFAEHSTLHVGALLVLLFLHVVLHCLQQVCYPSVHSRQNLCMRGSSSVPSPLQVDYVNVSFCRNADDLHATRQHLTKCACSSAVLQNSAACYQLPTQGAGCSSLLEQLHSMGTAWCCLQQAGTWHHASDC